MPTKIRALKDFDSNKTGDVFYASNTSAKELIKRKYAEKVAVIVAKKKSLEICPDKETAMALNEKTAKHPREIEVKQKKTLAEKDEEFKQQILKKMADLDLLIDTIQEIQKEVAGEEDTIIAEIIVATTRLVKDAIPESKNLFLSDKTGIGKDYTTKKTFKVLIPKEDHLHITKMSNEAFTYWHAGEDDWDWDNKVIHFEDITQNLLNTSTFKVMSSGGSFAVVVKDQKTIQIPINGKPCMVITSHHANPEDEALRRFPIGTLNDSLDQTTRIKDKISRMYTGREEKKEDFVLRSAVQSLDPYAVIIPYAELIQHFFPQDILMRTHYHRFLDYICSSTVFHQSQREKTEDSKLIATPDDYMIARLVLIYTTSNPKMIPMSKEYRDILQILQENVSPMSVSEIFLKCDQNKIWLYRHLPNLTATGLVIKDKREDKDANKPITTYQYAPGQNPNKIPTWAEIQTKIEKVIDKTDKTDKTKNETTEEKALKNWFYHNEIKLIKPNDDSGGFYLVFSDVKIPFNGEVLSVFTVLSQYLRKRDGKRYKRYYQELDLSQYEKIQEVKKGIDENRKAGYKIDDDFLYKNFDNGIIDGLTRSGQLIKQGNGEYVFGGN